MARKWQIILLGVAIIGGSEFNAMETKKTNDGKELKNSVESDAQKRRNSQSTSTPRMYFPYPGGKPEPEDYNQDQVRLSNRGDLVSLIWYH